MRGADKGRVGLLVVGVLDRVALVLDGVSLLGLARGEAEGEGEGEGKNESAHDGFLWGVGCRWTPDGASDGATFGVPGQTPLISQRTSFRSARSNVELWNRPLPSLSA